MTHADLELFANCIKEPTMRIDFLLILGLQNKNDLHWD